MKALRRFNVGNEQRVELKSVPGVALVFRVPGNTEVVRILHRDDGLGSIDLLTKFGLRLEGHPDASAFGEPESRERRAFVDAMDGHVISEIGTAILASTEVTEEQAGN